MRRLTDEQVLEERELIAKVADWPLWPLLPVKNLYRKGDDRIGVMLARELEPCRVHLTNLLTLRVGPLEEQLEGVNSIEYPTIEDAVRDGWVGD